MVAVKESKPKTARKTLRDTRRENAASRADAEAVRADEAQMFRKPAAPDGEEFDLDAASNG